MEQFKILEEAVNHFKAINNGEDKEKIGLHKVELYKEYPYMNHHSDAMYRLFEFVDENQNRTALEHARNYAYENIIISKKL